MGKKLEFALSILNGAVGDYLDSRGNGLATPMECIVGEEPIRIERAALGRAFPSATPRVVVLLHGLMCTESVWQFDGGGDYGAWLARDKGFTPVYVRYNSGLAIADNGARLAAMLEALVDAYPIPIEEILLLGFSMGGLVARSACHTGTALGHRWLPLVRRAIYVGTPHHGAPFERLGRVVTKLLHAVPDPYTRLVADIADLRSSGVKDLGDADLRHEDRARPRSDVRLRDWRHPVPLLPAIQHYLVAGALREEPWLGALFGDSIVPLRSALAGAGTERASAPLPADHVRIVPGVTHMALAHHAGVYAQIKAWCDGRSAATRFVTPGGVQPGRHEEGA